MSPAIPHAVSSVPHTLLNISPRISTPSRPPRRVKKAAGDSKFYGSHDVTAAAKQVLSKPAETSSDSPWKSHFPDFVKPAPLTPAKAGSDTPGLGSSPSSRFDSSRSSRLKRSGLALQLLGRDKKTAVTGLQHPPFTAKESSSKNHAQTPMNELLSPRIFAPEQQTSSLRSGSQSPSASPCEGFLSPMRPLSPMTFLSESPSRPGGDPFSRSASLFLASPSCTSSASVDSVFLSSSSDIYSIQYSSGDEEVSLFTESPLSHLLRDIKDQRLELHATAPLKHVSYPHLAPLHVKNVTTHSVKVECPSAIQFCCATVHSSRTPHGLETPARRPAMRAKRGDATHPSRGRLRSSPQVLRTKYSKPRDENCAPARPHVTAKVREKGRPDARAVPVERDLNVQLRRAVSSGASSTRPRVSSALSRALYPVLPQPAPALDQHDSGPRRPVPHKMASETQALLRFAIDDERHTIHRPALHQKLSLMARLSRKAKGEASVGVSAESTSPTAMYNMPLARVSTSNLLHTGDHAMPRLQSLRNMFKV